MAQQPTLVLLETQNDSTHNRRRSGRNAPTQQRIPRELSCALVADYVKFLTETRLLPAWRIAAIVSAQAHQTAGDIA
jgi:hypothetical protein